MWRLNSVLPIGHFHDLRNMHEIHRWTHCRIERENPSIISWLRDTIAGSTLLFESYNNRIGIVSFPPFSLSSPLCTKRVVRNVYYYDNKHDCCESSSESRTCSHCSRSDSSCFQRLLHRIKMLYFPQNRKKIQLQWPVYGRSCGKYIWWFPRAAQYS